MGCSLDFPALVRVPFARVAAASLMLAAAAPAWAASAADLTITLAATPDDSVSVSRSGLKAYIAYRVTLVNSSTNTINQVSLTGATSPDGTTPAAFAAVVNNSGVVATCGPTGAATISCAIGQMKSNDASDFFLLFQTPTDGSSMTFTLNTTFSEGNSPNTPPANVVGATLTDSVALTTTTNPQINAHVKTVLPPGGGTFFTGPNGVVSSTNPFASQVGLPSVTNLVTNNSIDLASVPSFVCSGSYYCYGLSSTINVDDAKTGNKVFYDQVAPGKYITIVLRQDISSLSTKKPVPKVGDVQIFYNPSPLYPGDVGTLVPPCLAGLPAEDQPCVSGRFDYVKGNKGYYEYWINAVDNGQLSW
jgi:hypothetical protein